MCAYLQVARGRYGFTERFMRYGIAERPLASLLPLNEGP